MSKYLKNIFFIKLYNSNQTINHEIAKQISDALTELKKYINRKGNHENDNSEKVVNIVEKILNFNNQQKDK